MKQGQATNSTPDRKTEPRSVAVCPAGVANLGLAQGDHADCGDFTPRMTPLYEGRGYAAPDIRATTNKSGSQGKY